MRRVLNRMLLACGSACLLVTGLGAQSYAVGAKIPFSFHAGGTTLEAGQYLIRTAGTSRSVQSIQNQNTGESIFVMSQPEAEAASAKARLVFHRYGRQYFLSEVYGGNGARSTMAVTRPEKEAQLATPASETATTTLLLVASR